VGGLPVRESAIAGAQDTRFSLEFGRVALRSSWRLAPTEWPPARECPALSAKSEIFQPFRFGNSVIFNCFRLIGGELLECVQ
jgi:hypothetical protein